MALSTITLFKRDFPNTTFADGEISSALILATDILENYCNRNFESTEYIEFPTCYSDQYIVVPNYPITKISDISPDLYNGIKISVDNTIYALNYTSDDISITFNTIELDGTETETIILYASAYKMSDLVVDINLITGVTAEIATQYGNEPSKKIKQDNGMILGGQKDWLNFYKTDLQMKWSKEYKTDNIIKVNRKLYNELYIRYTAGYIFPDDTVTPTVDGNVPNDLINVCNKLAYTLMNEGAADNLQTGIYKSEKLGDYAYTKFDNADSPVTQLLLADKDTLSKYVYKILTW